MRFSRVVVLAAAGYAVLQWRGRTAGATPEERSRALPGDDIVAPPLVLRTTHATTIAAPPERIWPWLVQMGWHRAGWYTARWVDLLLFPANWPSADHIVAELQDTKVGDFIPDGAPETGTGFIVEELATNQHMILHSTTHLPPGWHDRFGAWIDWTWAFVLEPLDRDCTRFLFRSRGRVGPWWLAAVYWLIIIPADFVMARQMMRGLAHRAEGRAEAACGVGGAGATPGL
jgi:hypothetical protein